MARQAGIGQEELRRVNVSALLTRVHVSGPTTRTALTAELGLNRSTIGDLTAQLGAVGLVSEEVPTQGRTSGRPSLVVMPRDDVTVLAITLDVDRITVALVGLGGRVTDRRTRVHQRGQHDVAHVVGSVAQMSRELLSSPRADRCLAVGASAPGAVRAADGLVRFAPNLGWVDAPFTELLSEELQMTVSTGNDANLGVLAEHLRGAAMGFQHAAYLSASVGIGGGFLVGGVPLRGAEGYAGEIGHIPVDPAGPVCRCGALGCWETKVGENHLLVDAGRLPGGGPDAVAEVIAAVDAGDRRATAALESVAHWTGVGLRTIVNLFNPQAIVVGGVLSQVWAAREDLVEHGLQRPTLIAPQQHLQIRPAGLGEDSSLIGAAELAFAPLLADPLGTTVPLPVRRPWTGRGQAKDHDVSKVKPGPG
jgi:predicted NBD/HSP70 family sugar kinase